MNLKVLSEHGKERRIRDFRKTAEIPKFFANGKKKDEQGIGRDGKDL